MSRFVSACGAIRPTVLLQRAQKPLEDELLGAFHALVPKDAKKSKPRQSGRYSPETSRYDPLTRQYEDDDEHPLDKLQFAETPSPRPREVTRVLNPGQSTSPETRQRELRDRSLPRNSKVDALKSQESRVIRDVKTVRRETSQSPPRLRRHHGADTKPIPMLSRKVGAERSKEEMRTEWPLFPETSDPEFIHELDPSVPLEKSIEQLKTRQDVLNRVERKGFSSPHARGSTRRPRKPQHKGMKDPAISGALLENSPSQPTDENPEQPSLNRTELSKPKTLVGVVNRMREGLVSIFGSLRPHVHRLFPSLEDGDHRDQFIRLFIFQHSQQLDSMHDRHTHTQNVLQARIRICSKWQLQPILEPRDFLTDGEGSHEKDVARSIIWQKGDFVAASSEAWRKEKIKQHLGFVSRFTSRALMESSRFLLEHQVHRMQDMVDMMAMVEPLGLHLPRDVFRPYLYTAQNLAAMRISEEFFARAFARGLPARDVLGPIDAIWTVTAVELELELTTTVLALGRTIGEILEQTVASDPTHRYLSAPIYDDWSAEMTQLEMRIYDAVQVAADFAFRNCDYLQRYLYLMETGRGVDHVTKRRTRKMFTKEERAAHQKARHQEWAERLEREQCSGKVATEESKPRTVISTAGITLIVR